jgi:hypothetical protein
MRGLLTIAVGAAFAQSPADRFEMLVRPVIVKNCFPCHAASTMGGLRLDSRDAILKGGKSGAAVVPGKPEQSLLIQAVAQTHARLKMPPGGKLSDADVAALTNWVREGAEFPAAKVPATAAPISHWAFLPLKKPDAGSIDSFIDAGLASAGLMAAPQADKRTLIRRASFDLTGLPPTPMEVETFLKDSSQAAYPKLIDRLLASPRYGERWGRYWLDLARYSDGQLGANKDTPFPNSWRYRDWVIQAFNEDMPYDLFVKAQLAGDVIPGADHDKLRPALGFHALGPQGDDRVDATTRVFLGITVACAQCHDHKFDPIPTKDFYSLQGVFRSSEIYQHPLADSKVVEDYSAHQKLIEDAKYELDTFVQQRSAELSESLARKTARYLMAAWKVSHGREQHDSLDAETLARWVEYLKDSRKDHDFLKPYFDLRPDAPLAMVEKTAAGLEQLIVGIHEERRRMEDRNYVKMGGEKGVRNAATRQYTNLESLEIHRYYLWRDLSSDAHKRDFVDVKVGVYYYGEKTIERWLGQEWRDELKRLQANYAAIKRSAPPQYPYINAVREGKKPANIRVAIRGDAQNPGEEAPRRFLSCLVNGEQPLFKNGSGRLELAEAIVAHPIAARVMVNRIWQLHFGQGIVRTPSNFGRMGDLPSHPGLLDYLAAKFIADGWSMKSMHREIMLSKAYRRSVTMDDRAAAKDPENRLLWRMNLRQRLDFEALRDSMLAVSGELNSKMGGPAAPMTDTYLRRTVYVTVSRTTPDATMALFDFPNPNITSEQRVTTVGPLQRLYFMNSKFVEARAKAIAGRLNGSAPSERIESVYRLLFSRSATPAEVRMGEEFLAQSGQAWNQYVQMLLASSEFCAEP